MIQSMTGYGKTVCELPNKKINIEIKSLNSKQLDLNTRIPNLYREKDLELRNEISRKVLRGKVDLSFYVESLGQDKVAVVNKPVIENYYKQLDEVAHQLGLKGNTDFLRVIMPLPDTVKMEQAALDEGEWAFIKEHFRQAMDELVKFRTQEGAVLEEEIKSRIDSIASLLVKVDEFEGERIEKIKTRIRENLKDLAEKGAVDENRFEQELIYYIEKLDVTEEKVRLDNHLKYFVETMAEEGAVGKKLGFIAQEIGREVNTLGSKANHADIQKIVIQMKDDLEKIKEQILNIL